MRYVKAITIATLVGSSALATPVLVQIDVRLPTVPDLDVHVPPYSLPTGPRMPSCFCPMTLIAFGRFIETENVVPFDVTVVLPSALRGAASIELWRLSRLERPEALVGTPWVCHQYRDAVITGFTRSRDVALMCGVESKLEDALICGEPNWIMDDLAVLAENLPEMIGATRFSPDFVATFNGPDPVRVEVSFRTREAIVRTKQKFLWVVIPPSEITKLRALAESLELPSNPRMVPRTDFPTS